MARKWYAVVRGRKTGIFRSYPECREQVQGYKGAVYKGFLTEAEAREYYYQNVQILNRDDLPIAIMSGRYNFYAIRKGLSPGIYQKWEDCKKNIGDPKTAEWKGFVLKSDAEMYMKGTDLTHKGKYYAVRVGDRTGVFSSWTDCKDAIGNAKYSVYKSFPTLDDAWAWFNSDDPKFDAADSDRSLKKYYVIREGKRPGIYTTWEECKQNLGKWEIAKFKGFNNYEDALEYMKIQDKPIKSHYKYYAVFKGDQPGVYESWDECKEAIGDIRNALFRGFDNKDDADQFAKNGYITFQKDTDEKSNKKGGKKSKKKYYAVKKGREVGIFNSWDECKRLVMGFPGALYKGFENIDDASDWMGECQSKNNSQKESIVDVMDGKPYAFVDGSYLETKKQYGYGGFLVYGEDKHIIFGRGQDPLFASMRNVGGELCGALEAVKMAIALELKEIWIIYDYIGIERFVTGDWKPTGPATQKYANEMKELQEFIDVHFLKVRGHSGVDGNERADYLAKVAAGVLPGYDKIFQETKDQ